MCSKTRAVDGIPLGRATGLRKIHVQQQQQYNNNIFCEQLYDIRTYTPGAPSTRYNVQYYYDVTDIDGRVSVLYAYFIGIPTVYFIAASMSVDDDDDDSIYVIYGSFPAEERCFGSDR